eukprot:351882-Chlamydomonas_euryale.AAC.6
MQRATCNMQACAPHRACKRTRCMVHGQACSVPLPSPISRLTAATSLGCMEPSASNLPPPSCVAPNSCTSGESRCPPGVGPALAMVAAVLTRRAAPAPAPAAGAADDAAWPRQLCGR